MIRWAVVGIGDIATRRVIPAIQRSSRSMLHAVVTSKPEKAARLDAAIYHDLDSALRDSAIDAIYLATPVFRHHPDTIAALRAGKHVLCEKPTALNYPQAEEMAREAEQSGRLCGVAYYRRTYPKVIEAARLIADGAIGTPVLAELNCHGWFNAEGGHRGWLVQKEYAGGGPLFDIASHRIDLCYFLFGTPVKATGLRSNVVHQNDVEDNATVLIEYGNGVRAVIDVRWHSRVDRDECRIAGTEGALELSPLNGAELETPTGTLHLPAHENLHFPLVEDFAEAVMEGRAPVCPIAAAIETDWVTSQIS